MNKFLILLMLVLSGCVLHDTIPCSHVISVTERGFGIVVETASTSSGTPNVKLGFFSSTVMIEPVTTNKSYTADFSGTFDIGQAVNPFALNITENTVSGDYSLNATNGSSIVNSQPNLSK